MLNRTPPNNTNTKNTLNAYRKRRQFFKGPFLIYTFAALLLIVGIALVLRATSGGNPFSAMFATETPTVTVTVTPSLTATPSITPTITETPTITITPSPTGVQDYVIIEGDTLPGIAEKFNLGPDGVPLIINANPDILANGGVYFVGQTLKIPPAGSVLPTATAIPPGRRTITYQVLPGDTLAGIAAKFNSREEDIITLNNIENANDLQAGQSLQIPVNLVTATATLPSTSTPVTPTVAGQPTLAPGAATATVPSSTACTPTENATFIIDLQTLLNKARTDNGLTALALNNNLSATAKAHAIDMVCNNYLSHIGLSGSTPETRVTAQNYTASLVLENLYALHPAFGGNPQSAFNWWMNDPTSRANILNADVTEFGIAYQFSDKSLLGGYFVVVFAKP